MSYFSVSHRHNSFRSIKERKMFFLYLHKIQIKGKIKRVTKKPCQRVSFLFCSRKKAAKQDEICVCVRMVFIHGDEFCILNE